MHDERLIRFDSGRAPPAHLHSLIRERIGSTRAATPDTRTRTLLALVAVPCLAAAAVAIASHVVYGQQAVGLDVNADAAGHMRLLLASLVALTIASTLAALKRSGRHAEIFGLLAVATLVVPVYAALTLVSPLHAYDPLPAGAHVSPWGARCLVLATVVGGLTLAAFATALRRAVPSASGIRGAALGAAAAAWAGLTVFVFCPSGEHPHLLIGHVLPMLALTVAGAILVPRALRP